MAYAIGHISGCHLNPAVTVGLWAGGRFPAREIPLYVVAQVLGAIAAAFTLYIIASGQPGFALDANGLAVNGVGELSPGGYSMHGRGRHRNRDDRLLPDHHHGLDPQPGAGGLRADRHRPWPDPHPPDLDPGDQHVGEPGAQHRVRRSSSAGWRLQQLWIFWVAPIIGGVIGGGLYKMLSPEQAELPGHRRRSQRLPPERALGQMAACR